MVARQVPVRIDRTSPVPLWHQLAEQLGAAVRDGDLQPGDSVENELVLAGRLGLSRPTVRRAMQDLVDRGLLVRRRGIGTTVAPTRVHRRAELSSLHDDLLRAGRTPGTRVLSLAVTRDEEAAAALELPSDTALLGIVRLRSVDGRPLAVLHNWLPPELSDLTAEELETTGLYAALRTRGAVPVVARQTVGARMPTPEERRRLGLRGTRPVLTMARTAFGAHGEPVEHANHCYDADAYALEMTLDER
ncbi:GntR family transcriptional regulator [Phycicoccus sp.]|uniref:GntR family transcriptional regulator n=1 Tax=Phycicoccus sp. TaxID=1902410 RepID=UPI002B541E33|nr:GntR family transcriptional regulator [Phycicoccus sp.]HMM96934.1 GntR family transcriptional regulator [Phycicoccus sp.]